MKLWRAFVQTPFVGLLCLSLSQSATAAPEDVLRAGAARIDITPTQPVTLAGYASRTEVSRGVHDPLSARALAFAQGNRKLVLVSLDNLGFYNDTARPLREAVLEGCGLEPSGLFLCAIHTHSAPALTLNADKGHPNNVAYTKSLQGKLVEVVRQAARRTDYDMGSRPQRALLATNVHAAHTRDHPPTCVTQ